MPQLCALVDGAAIFAPNILGSELNIKHGGADLRMAQKQLESGQRDAVAHHVGAEGVTKPMGIGLRDEAGGAMMPKQRAETSGSEALPTVAAFQGDEQRRRVS